MWIAFAPRPQRLQAAPKHLDPQSVFRAALFIQERSFGDGAGVIQGWLGGDYYGWLMINGLLWLMINDE